MDHGFNQAPFNGSLSSWWPWSRAVSIAWLCSFNLPPNGDPPLPCPAEWLPLLCFSSICRVGGGVEVVLVLLLLLLHLQLHLLLLLNTQSSGQLLEDADRSKLNRTSPSPANSLLIPFSRTAEFKTRHKTQENLRFKLGFYTSVLNIIIDIVICFIRWFFQNLILIKSHWHMRLTYDPNHPVWDISQTEWFGSYICWYKHHIFSFQIDICFDRI